MPGSETRVAVGRSLIYVPPCLVGLHGASGRPTWEASKLAVSTKEYQRCDRNHPAYPPSLRPDRRHGTDGEGRDRLAWRLRGHRLPPRAGQRERRLALP